MHRLQLKSAHSCSAPKPYGVCVFMLCEVTVTTLHGTSQSVPQSVSVCVCVCVCVWGGGGGGGGGEPVSQYTMPKGIIV